MKKIPFNNATSKSKMPAIPIPLWLIAYDMPITPDPMMELTKLKLVLKFPMSDRYPPHFIFGDSVFFEMLLQSLSFFFKNQF